MAAASNKRMTKEKIDVNDKNKKENESVFESNASGKSRQKTSRAGASKKAGHQTAAKTTKKQEKKEIYVFYVQEDRLLKSTHIF